MKQISAVEWLIEQFETIVFYSEEAKENTIKQAQQMFEEQIIDAHIHGHNASSSVIKKYDAEQYYKETFKTKEK